MGCSSSPEACDQVFTTEAFLNVSTEAHELNARAVLETKLLATLETRKEPYTLFLITSGEVAGAVQKRCNTHNINTDTALRSYLSTAGLSKDEFLTHPRLSDFWRTQVIPAEVDLAALTIPGMTLVYTSLAGREVTFTSATNADAITDTGFFVSDKPFLVTCSKVFVSPSCFDSV